MRYSRPHFGQSSRKSWELFLKGKSFGELCILIASRTSKHIGETESSIRLSCCPTSQLSSYVPPTLQVVESRVLLNDHQEIIRSVDRQDFGFPGIIHSTCRIASQHQASRRCIFPSGHNVSSPILPQSEASHQMHAESCCQMLQQSYRERKLFTRNCRLCHSSTSKTQICAKAEPNPHMSTTSLMHRGDR